MLSRQKRLRAREVEEVLSRGRSYRGDCLSMKFIATTEPFRAAVVVPKSLARKANVRNRLRRAAYDALAVSPLSLRTGRAVVFVRAAPSGALRPAFADAFQTLVKNI